MKACPICHSSSCVHEKKFFNFGLAKVLIIHRSLEATLNVFSKLATFLPANPEMQSKINLAFEDLRKCQDRMEDVKQWFEGKVMC